MTWLIIGAGVSGLGAAKLLRKGGATVRVSERAKLPEAKRLPFLDTGAEVLDGGHDPGHLRGVTHIVASPGLPPTLPLLIEAARLGIPVISEIDLALREFSGRLIGVTGTNGKSTTCAMLGHMLAALGERVSVGGNFGDPPTAILAEGRMGDFLVLELSSYQLEQSQLVAPEAAIFTSFSHDHLARHGSLAGYFAAKWRIFAKQPRGAVAVMPAYVEEQARDQGLRLHGGVELLHASADLFSASLLPLGMTERQNHLNAAFAALSLGHMLRVPPASLVRHLAGFRGLPHRCELVGQVAGGPVINDSKSTNVESTLVALSSMARPVILMMGGQGKGEPYAPILAEKAKIAAVVTFGASGPEIAAALRDQLAVQEFPTLKAAMAGIGGILKKYAAGVLFSPGCASFDEFNNYEHRGQVFVASMAPYLKS